MDDAVQSTLVFVDAVKIKQLRKAVLESVVKDCDKKIEEGVVKRCKNESPYMAGIIADEYRWSYATGFARGYSETSFKHFNISFEQLKREVLFQMVKQDVLPLCRACEEVGQSEQDFTSDMYDYLLSNVPAIATFDDVLAAIDYITFGYAERIEKEHYFVRLISHWLKAAPEWQGEILDAWLWDDAASCFSARGEFAGLMSIDIVARDTHGEYQAIGCKVCKTHDSLYAGNIAPFLAASAKMFSDPQTGKLMSFSNRLYIATTSRVTSDAECLAQNQQPPVKLITRATLESSAVAWQRLFNEAFRPLHS